MKNCRYLRPFCPKMRVQMLLEFKKCAVYMKRNDWLASRVIARCGDVEQSLERTISLKHIFSWKKKVENALASHHSNTLDIISDFNHDLSGKKTFGWWKSEKKTFTRESIWHILDKVSLESEPKITRQFEPVSESFRKVAESADLFRVLDLELSARKF